MPVSVYRHVPIVLVVLVLVLVLVLFSGGTIQTLAACFLHSFLFHPYCLDPQPRTTTTTTTRTRTKDDGEHEDE